MLWTVEDPFAEPRIHRAFPGGLEDLEVYRQEVVDGVHDHWICPEEGKWTYTYHKRLFAYDIEGETVDQIAAVVDRLARSGHTRRAQAITWNPKLDRPTEDPPCLQRLWFRMLEDEAGGLVLNMNAHWRSRDAYKAAYMNVFALTDLQRVVAGRIAEKTGRAVRVGRYADLCDSFHIYGSYFARFRGLPEDGREALVRGPDLAERLRRAHVRGGPRAAPQRERGREITHDRDDPDSHSPCAAFSSRRSWPSGPKPKGASASITSPSPWPRP